jgi:dolichyl-phosphate-mannose-protein mannosyltransferase
MMLGFAGILAGYDGSWDFKSSSAYPPEVNFVVMRIFCAVFGAFMVPLAYLTAIQLKLSKPASILCAVMVLCGIIFRIIC